MKIKFGKTSFTKVDNRTICSLPYEFIFNYDEGKTSIRKAFQQLLYQIASEYNLQLKGKMTASTTCSKEDVYDEVIGKRIAEAKVKMKVYKYAYEVFYTLHKHISYLQIGTITALDKHDALYNDETEHYEELLDNKNR